MFSVGIVMDSVSVSNRKRLSSPREVKIRSSSILIRGRQASPYFTYFSCIFKLFLRTTLTIRCYSAQTEYNFFVFLFPTYIIAFLIFVQRFLNKKATQGNTMKKLLTAIFSIVAGVAFAAGAFAENTNTTTSAISNPGFYVGAQGGVAIPDNDNVNTGFDVGGRVGYRFGNGFRVEEAFNYFRHNFDLNEFLNESNSDANSHINMYTLMTNGYYDFNTGTKIVPYLGTGIGLEYDSWAVNDGNNRVFSGTENNFAIQGIAGIAYQFSKNVAVDVQYRNLLLISDQGQGEDNNIIEVGLNDYFSI